MLAILRDVKINLQQCSCDEWGGAESRGTGARPVEWMIMNDTCATHRSRVPRRSFGRNKRSDDIEARPGFLSPLPMSSLLLLFLPKLLRGTRDRWVAQVSFIIIHSTGLAPFPRLSAPPHSSQFYWPIINFINGKISEDSAYTSCVKEWTWQLLVVVFLEDLQK